MILCCGEALIDMLPGKTDGGEAAFVPHVGGAVFNTAIALGRLGIPTGLVSGLSRDVFGQSLVQALNGSGVDLRHAHFSDRPTTLAFAHLRDGHAVYSFYDENSAGRMVTQTDLPLPDESVTALHFSCISLVAEPCGTAYETLMRREHQRRVIMLDPNIRQGFITDRPRHLERMRRMIAMSDIVKLSDEDMDWFGEGANHDDIAQRWLTMGPTMVVLTRGAQGAVGYTTQTRVELRAPPVDVVDTVGAGDTFNAGLLGWLHDTGLLSKENIAGLSRNDLSAALDFATKAAAITVSRAGANPPWRSELGSLKPPSKDPAQ